MTDAPLSLANRDNALSKLRNQFARVLVPLLWLNVGFIAVSVLFVTEQAPLFLIPAAALLAGATTFSWWKYG